MASDITPDQVSLLLPPNLTPLVASWLAEDAPSFDYSGPLVGVAPTTATLLCKSAGVLAGTPFVSAVFEHLSCTVVYMHAEGTYLSPAEGERIAVAKVAGPARNLLLGERVALNTLARSSGIATAARRLVQRARALGYTGAVAGTRKTTPGFRVVEKYAMLVGGADPHRHDLSSMIMLKDNHVWACNNQIRAAVQSAKRLGGFAVKVEVECRTEDEAVEAAGAGADVVMLDNFQGEELKIVAERLKQRWREERRQVLLECSGGVTEKNLGEFVCNDIDIISTSSIHQGVPHVDFSLKIDH